MVLVPVLTILLIENNAQIISFNLEKTNLGILKQCLDQGLVKGAILCFRNLYFYFRHGESTSTASQLTSPASQKSKDLNKVLLLLQDLGKIRDYFKMSIIYWSTSGLREVSSSWPVIGQLPQFLSSYWLILTLLITDQSNEVIICEIYRRESN